MEQDNVISLEEYVDSMIKTEKEAIKILKDGKSYLV